MTIIKIPNASSSNHFSFESSYGRNKYVKLLKAVSSIVPKTKKISPVIVNVTAKSGGNVVYANSVKGFFSTITPSDVLSTFDECLLATEVDSSVQDKIILVSCFNEEAHDGQNSNPLIDVYTEWKPVPDSAVTPVFSASLLSDLGVALYGTSLKSYNTVGIEMCVGYCPVASDNIEIKVVANDGNIKSTMTLIAGSGDSFAAGPVTIRYYTPHLTCSNGQSTHTLQFPVFNATQSGQISATSTSIRAGGSLRGPTVTFTGDSGLVTEMDFVAQASRLAFELMQYYAMVSIYRAEDQDEVTTFAELMDCDDYSINTSLLKEREARTIIGDNMTIIGRNLSTVEDSVESLDTRVTALEEGSHGGSSDMDSLYVRG